MTSNCCAFSCFSSCTRKCKRPSKEDLELSGPMNASSNSRYVTACTTLGEYATTSALPSSDPAPSGSSMERNESVEESIEGSKSHWSEVVKSDPSITDDELVKDNRAVFRELQSHPIWGGFFRTFGYTLETPVAGMPGYIHVSSGKLIVGEKFAEGGQAELFHARVIWYKSKINKYFLKHGYEWVMKVFKKGTSLRQLQSQWPLGYLQFRGELGSNSIDPKLVRYYCEVFFGILLEDGRFAFLMKREHKDLRKLIDQRMLEIGQGEGPFSKEDGELIMYKIACGMNWLHERNIIHRDLKASNVLCRVYGNAYLVYVADFECSIGVIGTGFWRAPEILQAIKDRMIYEKIEVFSKKADVYAYGMTCYEILTGKFPFGNHSNRDYDIVLNDGQLELPKYVEDWIDKIVKRCWNKNPIDRPSFIEILDLFANNSARVSNHIKKLKIRDDNLK